MFLYIIGILSPRYPNSVYALFDEDQSVGTAFAISDKHLLSCQHFMNGRKILYDIALVAEKKNNVVTYVRGKKRIKVIKYNAGMDYAVLELVDRPYDLIKIPIFVGEVEADIDLKVFHFPVTSFNSSNTGSITPFTQWMKSSISVNHHLPCSGTALLLGSSGAPYVNRNGCVVGLHIESVNNTVELDFELDDDVDSKLKIISETVNSNANAHGSIVQVLLIAKCPKLVQVLRDLDIIAK